MTEQIWQWYASTDGERYTVGPEDSREAVIELATNDFDGEPFTIVVATKGEAILRIFDNSNVIELLDGANEDNAGEDGESLFDDVTREQADALASLLNSAMEFWAKLHNIKPDTPWAFGQTRNQEDITPERAP